MFFDEQLTVLEVFVFKIIEVNITVLNYIVCVYTKICVSLLG